MTPTTRLLRDAHSPCRRHGRSCEVLCEAAGFEVQRYDDGFAFVHLHDQRVFDLDLIPNFDRAANHAGCYVITHDVDWHTRLVAAGLNVTAVMDQPWGMHEFRLTDPNGNNIRVGLNIADGKES